MSVYLVISRGTGNGRHSPQVLANSGFCALKLTHRLYGEDVPSNLVTGGAVATSMHGNVASGATPEKANTRSPTGNGTYSPDNADTMTLIAPALFILNNAYSHNSVLFGTRYAPIAFDTERIFGGECQGGAGGVGTNTLNQCAAFSESPVVPARRISKRTTRAGYAPFLGNAIGSFMKTGSGAYSIIASIFETDVYHTDVSAWRNGVSQPPNNNLIAPVVTAARRRAAIF